MEKLSFKGILIPVVSLFAVCAGVTIFLSCTNMFTDSKIKEQDLISAKASRQSVLPLAEDLKKETYRGTEYYKGIDSDGATVGYVFLTESKGYGGTIKVMTGITSDARVSGVDILSHSETPGLGANIEKDNFKHQFMGELPGGEFSVVKGTSEKTGEVAALTGATISSKAVTVAVNEAKSLFEKIKGGSGL